MTIRLVLFFPLVSNYYQVMQLKRNEMYKIGCCFFVIDDMITQEKIQKLLFIYLYIFFIFFWGGGGGGGGGGIKLFSN